MLGHDFFYGRLGASLYAAEKFEYMLGVGLGYPVRVRVDVRSTLHKKVKLV